jgi:hypothetical protein
VRNATAWAMSIGLGAGLYAALLLVGMAGLPITVEGPVGERLGVWSWAHIPVGFALIAVFVPRCWGVPAGVLAGSAGFIAAMAWGGLWETGPNYEGPGPGLAVVVLALMGLVGSVAGALARTVLAAWRRVGAAA